MSGLTADEPNHEPLDTSVRKIFGLDSIRPTTSPTLGHGVGGPDAVIHHVYDDRIPKKVSYSCYEILTPRHELHGEQVIERGPSPSPEELGSHPAPVPISRNRAGDKFLRLKTTKFSERIMHRWWKRLDGERQLVQQAFPEHGLMAESVKITARLSSY